MQRLILFAIISSLFLVSLALSGCGVTINVALATPSITPVIATSAPFGSSIPTLTPFPTFAQATNPPTSTATAQATSTIAPSSAVTTQPIIPTQTQAPPPPPPPTKLTLPQLPVFDKDGNNMEGRVFGTPLGTTFITFRAMVCSPNCSSKPDGSGVTSVQFDFYKGTTQSRTSLNNKKPIFTQKENNQPYCSFGGGDPCPNWVFAEHGNKWPNGAPIENGDYTLLINANGDNRNNGLWRSVINFSIQR